MSKKQTRKSYPKVFKEEAVALMTEQGYSAAKAAEARMGVKSRLDTGLTPISVYD